MIESSLCGFLNLADDRNAVARILNLADDQFAASQNVNLADDKRAVCFGDDLEYPSRSDV